MDKNEAIKVFPNELGYVILEPVSIVKKDGLYIPENHGRKAALVGKVISNGEFEGKYVLYHYAKREEYVFNGKKLFMLRLSSLLGIIEIPEGYDIVDEIRPDVNAEQFSSDFNANGVPLVEDYTRKKIWTFDGH
jgi:hypothetical protein